MTSEIYTTDILDKEHFWNEELMKVNEDFLFGCSTGVWGRGWGERKGIVELHAYSVLKAREIDGVRLVLLKNPWGKHEWKGAWSDGSKEWTAEWLQKLDHKFGDDGSFWISYEDLLKKYQAFDRTRLFGPEWKVASIWTTLNVSWTLDYHDTKFAFTLTKSGPVVIVFAQLDDRYFRGLEGQYRFELGFRVHKAGEEDYVVRSQNYYRMNRSVNVELDLEAGEYVVVVKVDAQRNERVMPVEEVVRAHAKERREKLLRVGFAYDVAHSKGKIIETKEEQVAREAYDKRKTDADRRKLANALRKAKMAAKRKDWRDTIKKRNKAIEARAKAKAKSERRAARKKAKMEEKESQESETKIIAASTGKPETGGKTDWDGKEGQEETVVMTAEGNKAEDIQNETSETKQDAADNLKAEDTPPESPAADEKHVTTEDPNATGTQAEGSSSSAGVGTPASSIIVEKAALTDDDPREGEDNYVTAAEEDEGEKIVQPTEKQQPQEEGDEPETPRVTQPPTNTTDTQSTLKTTTASSTQASVDVGVQTGPGLLEPPPTLSRKHRSQLPHVSSSSYPPPPPPGPSYLYSRAPVRDLSQIPPHMRAAYVTAYTRAPSVISLSETDSDASDDPDTPSDVSDVSDDDIDAMIQSAEAAAAARAVAVAAAAGKNGPPPPEATTEEDLLLDEFERDPWNAVGVFGLRVYYKVATDKKESQSEDGEDEEEQEVVRLRVERPNQYVWDESDSDGDDGGSQADDEKEDGAEETKVLDVDDSSKDAVGEKADVAGSAGEKRESAKDKKEEGEEEKDQSEKNEDDKWGDGKDGTDEKETSKESETKDGGKVDAKDDIVEGDGDNEAKKEPESPSETQAMKTSDEPEAEGVKIEE